MNLAEALKHLRMLERDLRLIPDEVVLELKPSEFIWVDQICINQGDEKERDIQVANMDKIYGTARMVWV